MTITKKMMNRMINPINQTLSSSTNKKMKLIQLRSILVNQTNNNSNQIQIINKLDISISQDSNSMVINLN